MNGWTGKLLNVDLTTRESWVEDLDPVVLEQFLGGRGLGAYLLYTRTPANVDPLGPENLLAFCTGPLTGTKVPTGGRSSLTVRSPLTNTVFDSNSGSQFGVRLKWAGFDALVIRGKATEPVWLEVTSAGAVIHPANDLWGKEVPDTAKALDARGSEVVCIGPAGENLSLMASVMSDSGNAYGRGGVGAVMGAKNLKAIRATGSDRPSIADEESYDFVDYEARKWFNAAPRTTQGLPEFGTSILVNLMNWYGILPVRNFQDADFEGAENISGERLRAEFLRKRGACWGCPIGCKRNTKTSHAEGEGPEYETIYAFGSSLCIDNFEVVIEANYLCNRLGLDTISTGATIACAMELAEKGRLDTELRFGRDDLLLKTVEDIAYRRGLGDELADGSKRLSEKYGMPETSMQVKGLELPAYDPRGMQGQGLLYATSNRGACHLRGNMLGPELLGAPKMLDRFTPSGKSGMVIVNQNTSAVMDSIGMCKFANFAIGDEFLARFLTTICGVKYEVEDVQIAGERIYNLERMYNLRAGFTRKDDTLPERFLKDPLTKGRSAGHVVNLEYMLNEYFRARSWSNEGVPSPRKLEELKLTELVAQFQEGVPNV